MSVNIRLAVPEDEEQCSKLLDVLAEATSDPNNIFDSNKTKPSYKQYYPTA